MLPIWVRTTCTNENNTRTKLLLTTCASQSNNYTSNAQCLTMTKSRYAFIVSLARRLAFVCRAFTADGLNYFFDSQLTLASLQLNSSSVRQAQFSQIPREICSLDLLWPLFFLFFINLFNGNKTFPSLNCATSTTMRHPTKVKEQNK